MRKEITILIIKPVKAACSWSLSPFDHQSNKSKAWKDINNSRYPFKLLRYWFIYHMIREEAKVLGYPPSIAEIGIDRGQMLHFTRDAGFADIGSWVGIDCEIKHEAEEAGYTRLIKADVESANFCLGKKYDIVILLHVLEHLWDPEKLIRNLTFELKPGGIIVGGFPVMPHFLIRYWQKRLRIVQGKNGHVSAFSPQRIKKIATDSGLNIEYLSGAFICRSSGRAIEQYRLWMRFNLLYGAVFFKSLGSELYFLMRKPI